MAKEYDMIPGLTLSPALQQEVLRSFVHRYTGTHLPEWSRKPAPNGNFYAPQYTNDAEWMAKTLFPVEYKKGSGEMKIASGKDVHCQSNTPSFPWGEWLTEPFKTSMPLKESAAPDVSMGV